MASELRRPERTFTIRQLCLEFKATPRALRFYEDKGLLNPARQGLNRVYSYRDRARLQMILQGKRVGLSLAEIRDILDSYNKSEESGITQKAKMLRKFRERIITLEQQRHDVEEAIKTLQTSCENLEKQLTEVRPDLLPKADDYDKVVRARVDHHHELAAK